MYIKCIILVTNFQKSSTVEDSPAQHLLTFDIGYVIWPNCGFSNWLWWWNRN